MKPQEDAPRSNTPAALAWSGDGRLLAYCSDPGRIVIAYRVDDASARELGVPIETDLVVDALALSHEGEWLAVGGSGTVALWWHDAARQHAIAVTRAALPGNPEVRIELAFAPDSRSLAVAQGSQMLLLRLDLEALRKLRHSTLRIRAESPGKHWNFVLDTPAGQLSLRQETRPELDTESLMSQLRPALVVIDPESHNGNASPVERLDFALAPLRRRLLPIGLGESKAMGTTDHFIVLDVDAALAGYPWELLLTGRGSAPLAVTHGLVRMRAQPADALLPNAADAPMHALLLSAVGAAHGTSSSSSDLDHAQAARLAETLRDAGEWQGQIAHRSRIPAQQAIEALFERDWRLLVLVGTPNDEGEVALGDGAMLGHREVRAMRRVPDFVLLLGGDFRRQAALMAEAGVAVCIASGWPIDTESLWCFFSEFLRVMRGGEPLHRAVQMARQYAHTRSAGTAWALEVHGDPLTTWPELPVWREPVARAGAEPNTSAKEPATIAVPDGVLHAMGEDPDRPDALRAGWDDWALLINLSTRWSAPVDLKWGNDAQAFAEWLRAPDGGGLPAERVVLLQHETGGWHALSEQLAAILDAQDKGPSRRLYFVLACAAKKISGELSLVFGGGHDDIRSTPFNSFESYLLQQIGRRRFREIVFVVDTVPAEQESAETELRQPLQRRSVPTPPSTVRYLRLLLNHSIYPGDSLMRRVLAVLAGDAANGLAGAVTSSSLVSYLLRSNGPELSLVEAHSTGEFALTAPHH